MKAGADTGVVVVHVTDELDLATTPRLRERVERALAARPTTVAVDLSDCPFLGVDAVQVLVELTAQARRQGTSLVLVGLHRIVRRVISVLELEDRLLYAAPPVPRTVVRG